MLGIAICEFFQLADADRGLISALDNHLRHRINHLLSFPSYSTLVVLFAFWLLRLFGSQRGAHFTVERLLIISFPMWGISVEQNTNMFCHYISLTLLRLIRASGNLSCLISHVVDTPVKSLDTVLTMDSTATAIGLS